MARKSMIEPTLPRGSETAGEGILNRIIAHDREQSGRAAPDTIPTNETNVTTLQRSPEETNDAANQPDHVNDNAAEPAPAVLSVSMPAPDVSPASVPAPKKSAPHKNLQPLVNSSGQANFPGEDWQERQAIALQRATEDEIAVVTVRAPQKLNGYIDRYVERVNRVAPKRRYRKQDAVAEMFAWFYASHPMPPAPDEEDL